MNNTSVQIAKNLPKNKKQSLGPQKVVKLFHLPKYVVLKVCGIFSVLVSGSSNKDDVARDGVQELMLKLRQLFPCWHWKNVLEC
jgi:hypothetical protein